MEFSENLGRQANSDKREPASTRGHRKTKARSNRKRTRIIFLVALASTILLAIGLSYSNAQGIANSIQMSCLSFSTPNFSFNVGFTNPTSTPVNGNIAISGEVLNHIGGEHSGGPGSLIFNFSNDSAFTLQPNQLTHTFVATGKNLANGTLANGSLFHLQMTIREDYSIFPYHFQHQLPINTIASTTSTTITYTTGC